MMQDDKENSGAGDGSRGSTGSGSGADSALAAMLRKRQQRAENADPCAAETAPDPRDPLHTVPPAP